MTDQTKQSQTDSRIKKYCIIAQRMLAGKFDMEVPVGNDDIGRLGSLLGELGQTLKNQFAVINGIEDITAKINAGLTLDEVLNHVYNHFRHHIPFDRLGFSLLEDNGRILRAIWARSESSDIKIKKGYSAQMEGSSLQDIIQTGRPRIINNLVDYLASHPDSEPTQLIVAENMRSSLTCPLIADKAPIGFIFFTSMHSHTYEKAHVEIFSQLAGELAVIIEKAHLYQQLLELNEMKDRFLGIAAHDLRGPIMVIKGFAEFLNCGIEDNNSLTYKDIYERITAQCDKMLALIFDILDISAIESGKIHLNKQRIDLISFFKESISTNTLLAKAKGITLNLDIKGTVKPVLMDPNRISQVLDNLITNAVKFSETGTTITVCVKQDLHYVNISIKDQGQGIPEADIPRIFQPFSLANVRPTAGEPSTGLGLAIVKKIVEMHNGAIKVESKVGVGTTVTFSLPID